MKSLSVTSLLLLLFCLLFSSCSLFESEEEEEELDRHPDYIESKSFNFRNFDYLSYNRRAFEGGIRSDEEMHKHRPEVLVEEKGNKITLTFKDHPHKKSHYWSWFEIRDYSGNAVYVDCDFPNEEQKTYKKVIFPEDPFTKRIRVRCFCQVHGEFVDYIDLPDFTERTIIDLD